MGDEVPEGVALLRPEGPLRLSFGAIGDVGIVGRARLRARALGHSEVLAPIAAVLRPLDLGFANLEFPVADPTWIRPGRTWEFWHEADVAAGLAAAGVTVVSLANNHVMDAGERGLLRTLEACRAAGLATAGAGLTLAEARAPARLEVRGLRVIVLAYGAAAADDRAGAGRAGVAPLEPALVREDVARWRAAADVLVVSAHWGSMYVERPPGRVVALASELAATGADVVLGHHPHVLQGFRREGRTLTLFSLGDAAFDSGSGELAIEWTRAMRRATGAFVLRIADAHGLDVHPLVLDDDGLPHAASAPDAQALAARLVGLSADWEHAGERFEREGATNLVRYELGALREYVRRGQWGRVLRLLGAVRPRHAAILLGALRARMR